MVCVSVSRHEDTPDALTQLKSPPKGPDTQSQRKKTAFPEKDPSKSSHDKRRSKTNRAKKNSQRKKEREGKKEGQRKEEWL